MKLVVHLGLHRAASTALQHWLKECRPAWEAQRCFVHLQVSSAESISPFAILVGKSLRAMGEDAVGDFLLAALDGGLGGYAAGLVSDENLTGHMPYGGLQPFSSLPQLAGALRRLARHHEVLPMIVLREHESWLRSMFHAQQLRGESLDFAGWAAQLSPNALRFAPVLDALREAVGRPPLVLTQERLAAGQGQDLQRRLEAALGLAEEDFRPLPVTNRSQYPLLRRICAVLGRDHAILAGYGGARMMKLMAGLPQDGGAADKDFVDELVKLVAKCAVPVPWNQPPGQRVIAANVRFGSVALDPGLCRAAVEEALAPQPAAGEAELPLHLFAEDRHSVGEAYLSEWRTR